MQTAIEPIRIPDSGRAQRLHVVAGACSIQGARRDRNEDSQYVSPDMDLFIVADGMGGHAAGEVASKFAVDVLSHELAKIAVETTQKKIEFRVHAALDRANCLILDSATAQPELRGAGTTVVFGLLLNHRLYITGVGDSRAYLVRAESIERLTIDDTWPDTMFHLGQMSADEAERHHMRNRLLSALGMEEFNSNQEDIRAIDVYDGDRYLLASDGLTDAVDEERLLQIVSQNNNPQMAAEMLKQEAIACGAGDDVTCVVFYVQSEMSHESPTAPSPTIWQQLISLLKTNGMTAATSTSKGSTIAKSKHEIPVSLINTVCQRLAQNHRVRRTLPVNGRLHIDRQLPFLCVYRQPPERTDAGTERLVQGEASYLIAPGAAGFRSSVSRLTLEVVRTLAAEFGAFLIVEIWAASDGGKANDPAVPSVLPTFSVHAPSSAGLTRTVEALEKRLKRIKVLKHGVEVEVIRDGKAYPPQMRPLLKASEARELNCSVIGLAVPPVYRKPDSPAEFPLLSRILRRNIGLALRQAYYEFSRSHTTHRPPHYHSLGRKAVVKAVWDIDRRLAAVSNQFDYLLQLTPVNTVAAWKQFQRERFEKAPEFHYRPLPIDPALLKRELYKIPIERVEDPALQRLFQEKQEELELKITMLRDRDTRRFLPESLQLFGGVQDKLLQLAKKILDELPTKTRRENGENLTAAAFAERVEQEFHFYRQVHREFNAKTQIANDISGLIVSRGKLLINSDLSLPPSRVEALLAHEVGTHLVTYYNGRAEPFQQLYSGLAGYEELQEGLAVLAEYLVGGLSVGRMRQPAARVVAVRCRTDGCSFVETFRTLDRNYDFTHRVAYNITMRIFRGGGLTKDAVYLRGLEAILRYVQKGGDLNPLLVGKMAVDHISTIKELQYRKVLNPAPVVPRYMLTPTAIERLESLRDNKCSVVDLARNGLSHGKAGP